MLDLLNSTKIIKQLKERSISLGEIKRQIKLLKQGVPYIHLDRAATINDGIQQIPKNDFPRLKKNLFEAVQNGRIMKFVPASGAASRMFSTLIRAKGETHLSPEMKVFFEQLNDFAFYESLKNVFLNNGKTLEKLLQNNEHHIILETILDPQGLNYANLPKGLIEFHRYSNETRTPIYEHIIEALHFANRANQARIHFTLSEEHISLFQEHIKFLQSKIGSEYKCQIEYSTQKSSTDAIALDINNQPVLDLHGNLNFRPGGHGSLLENIEDLKGDIVFIKNIDNISPNIGETYLYKALLGGLLFEIQKQTFDYLLLLDKGNANTRDILDFAQNKLSLNIPKDILEASQKEQNLFLKIKLNRPIRICGMVKNEGEPGGGPFWIQNQKGQKSLQIVEKTQVDNKNQKDILESSTHFNPVNLVCGLKNYQGSNFKLKDFIDPHAALISNKTDNSGNPIKVLEHPGLWNGGMADWNTLFVEMPITTFNPVKTVFDLLRKEHQYNGLQLN